MSDFDYTYLSGEALAHKCRYKLNYQGFLTSPEGREDWYFCKLDRFDEFIGGHALTKPSVLITHNSDYAVTERYISYANDPNILVWYAQNVNVQHPKIRAVPIGLTQPWNPHGECKVVKKVQGMQIAKKELVCATYSIVSNNEERQSCYDHTGIPVYQRCEFEPYLIHTASHYFSLSPKGNGIDCHRTWEALYMKTIPITTYSPGIQYLATKFPIIIIPDWSYYPKLKLSEEMYHKLWRGFNPDVLKTDNYVAMMEREILDLKNEKR